MSIDLNADEARLREQIIDALAEADSSQLREIAKILLEHLDSSVAKEPQVPYEPEVPLILRKPSPEQLTRELNESSARNDHISSEEAFRRLRIHFGEE